MKLKSLLLTTTIAMGAFAANAATEIHFINCGSDTDPFAIAQAKHIAAWEEANPDYTVNAEFAGWGECQGKAQTLAAAGNPAALAYMGSRTLKQLAASDLILPIDLSAEELATYTPSVQGTASFDGKIWGLPRAFSTKALYWNKSLFEKAGLSTDKAPETWDEVMAAAKAITENTDAAGIGIPAAEFDNTMHEFLNWMYSNGGEVIDAEGNIAFNSPEVVETLQFMADLEPYMEEGPFAYDRAELKALFANEQIGMYTNGGWGRTDDSVPADSEWGVALIPKGPSGDHSTLLITDSIAVFKSDVSDAAMDLAKFLTSPENQAEADEEGGWTPIRGGEKTDALIEKDPTWGVFINSIPTGGPEPLMTDYIATQDVINRAIQDVIAGDETAEDAAADAAEELEDLK